ncbi:MAG: AAA family ATPase [bacterium]
MIERPGLIEDVEHNLKINPVVALLGPRQCGKTTLARIVADRSPKYEFFDLENPVHLSRLSAPMKALESLAPQTGRFMGRVCY